MSDKSFVCPNCLHPNEAYVDICANCGSPMPSTIPVRTPLRVDPSEETVSLPELQLGAIAARSIVFAVVGYSHSLAVQRQDEIVLGRYVLGEEPPAVDLGKYNGHLLGVSRRHAVVRFSRSGCVLEDLNSANGTWINENQLRPFTPHPLHGGEQIRLGNLIMFVYFSDAETLLLSDSELDGDTPHVLTPRVLASKLSPYLQKLADLQMAVNQILGTPNVSPVIENIVTTNRQVFELKISKASEALDLLMRFVRPWKTKHARTLQAMKTAAKARSPEPDEQLQQMFSNAVYLLAQDILNHLLDAPVEEHIQLLQQALTGLLLNPLDVVTRPADTQVE